MAVKTEPVDTSVPLPAPPPAAAPAKGKPRAKPADNSPGAKAKARKALWDFRKATAWPVYRWPIEKRVVEEKTVLHLPRNYMALAGEDVVTLWPGMDVNQAIHRHYMGQAKEEMKEEGEDGRESKRRRTAVKGELGGPVQFGANYVAGDEVIARRCAKQRIVLRCVLLTNDAFSPQILLCSTVVTRRPTQMICCSCAAPVDTSTSDQTLVLPEFTLIMTTRSTSNGGMDSSKYNG